MTDYQFRFRDRLLARMRRSPIGEIKRCLKLAELYDLPIDARQLEAHHLAGGRIGQIVDALIYAKENGLNLPVVRALAQDIVSGKTQPVKDWLIDCQRRGVTNVEREPFGRPK